MRFLFDECLHESLVGVAHAAGFEATHVNHLGLSGTASKRALRYSLSGIPVSQQLRY
jgi:hypothetical protein